ncbi:MAG: VOC family protein [Candidatus Poseidoniales archaeon]|nr:MAG: VOC family protein [Candidatus Poseidoniales archaeon]
MSFGPIYIDHIGIAAHGLDDNSDFWRLIGLVQGERDETVADQGVTTRFFSTSTTDADAPVPKVELLEPTGDDTPIGRFLEKRGPGVQQVCFSVGDLSGLLTHLADHGVRLIDKTPRLGAGGHMIAFVHPSSTGGVLVELSQRT